MLLKLCIEMLQVIMIFPRLLPKLSLPSLLLIHLLSFIFAFPFTSHTPSFGRSLSFTIFFLSTSFPSYAKHFLLFLLFALSSFLSFSQSSYLHYAFPIPISFFSFPVSPSIISPTPSIDYVFDYFLSFIHKPLVCLLHLLLHS